MKGNGKKLCAGALGIAFGVVTGLCMLIFAWASNFWGFGTNMVDQWAMIYPGYAATVVGGVIGFFWGLLEGFVVGFIIGSVYNCVCCCCKCRVCCSGSSCDMDTKNKM